MEDLLPTGTVTLLFSDIEGSTSLLSRLGDRYGEALSAQRILLRAAFSANRGHEMGTEGDSFFVVFESAGDAVRACLAAQLALSAHRWPDGVGVRVRMGLHSGEPVRHEDGYVGMDVHRAARIAATAHGGQVVLSETTRVLAQSQLPAEVTLADLGYHRLKDFETPERIYQLLVPGLQQQFPPLKSLGAQSSLPVPMTALIGRDADLGHLRAALAVPGIRLVTLTGTGGVGKTRLALAAAASLDTAFPHGVFFVALAAVSDADVMWKTIADTLDISGEGSAADAVTGHVSDRQALLVLDNLEQLDGAAEVVAALLAAGARLTVLATSRRPLHLHGEHEQPVPPLDIPGAAAGGRDRAPAVAASGAAMLFVQHAGMVRPGFAVTEANAADVAAICRRLDGLPLAIELAAARVKLLGPAALRARLGSSLGLTAADVGRPSRQQTLRQTIAWSYDLLSEQSASVLRRAAVFTGGCDLEALAAVAAADSAAADHAGSQTPADPLQLAAELLDVSLITVSEGVDGEPRVAMLETIREFALEQLRAAGELAATWGRHARHYAALAEQANQHIGGPAQLTSLDRLEAEHDNLRAALTWSLQARSADGSDDHERVAIGLRLVQALTAFWYQHGHATEGRQWLEQAIALASHDDGAPLAQMAHGLGILLTQQGEFGAAMALFEQSLVIWRDLGDRDQQAKELNSLGITHAYCGDLDIARSLLHQSIEASREIGSDYRLAAALTSLGQVEISAGEYERATQTLREALALDQRQGDLLGMTIDRHSLAMVSLLAGQVHQAGDYLAATFGYLVSAGNSDILVTSLELAASIAAELGDRARAARLAGAAAALRLEAGMPAPDHDAARFERFMAPARAATDGQTWAAEMAAGGALTDQERVELLTGNPSSRQ